MPPKLQMSALDVRYAVKELQQCVGSRLQKVYVYPGFEGKLSLLLELHSTGVGLKRFLCKPPYGVGFIASRPKVPKFPPDICTVFRKYLQQGKIVSIRQHGFDRILVIRVQRSDKIYCLMMELYNKGNIVLCQDDMKIIAATVLIKRYNKTIRGGINYKIETKASDISKLTVQDIQAQIKKTTRFDIVRFLAVDIGLGGYYSELLCSMIDINKDADIRKASQTTLENMCSCIHEFTHSEMSVTVDDDGVYALGGTGKGSYLDAVGNRLLVLRDERPEMKPSKRLLQLRKRVEIQQQAIEEMKKKALVHEKTGEFLFHNYQSIKQLLVFSAANIDDDKIGSYTNKFDEFEFISLDKKNRSIKIKKK